MTENLERAEQAAILGSFITAISEEGFPANLLSAGTELEIPTLLVRLSADAEGRERWLTVNVMPSAEGESRISLAQFYCPLPFRVADTAREQLDRVAVAVASLMPVGAIGIGDDGEIFIRYMLATSSRTTPDPAVVADLVSLIEHEADIFGPGLEAAATGNSAAEEVLAELVANE